jgi:hypothetical protein
MALQSNAGLRLLNGLPQLRSVFDLSFQFVILDLLLFVCTQLHHLFFGRHLSRLPCGLLLDTLLTFSFIILSVDLSKPI